MTGPKRLIEVDLPIKRISAHAGKEKSIRNGHISTLHVWWARRPLAACRAVVLGALWPDPADPACPATFVREASASLARLRDAVGGRPKRWRDGLVVRQGLLDFLAEFSHWETASEEAYLQTAREITASAHRALGVTGRDRPFVFDPFAGGAAFPVEALRIGADVMASDLNPVAVALNKVLVEYAPQLGLGLRADMEQWARWVKERAQVNLAELYPSDVDGSIPIAWVWARTVRCEGPDCGAEVPMLRSLWLAKKGVIAALKVTGDKQTKTVRVEVLKNGGHVGQGTARKGGATCPVCEYTTAKDRVRAQLAARGGGSTDARLVARVVIGQDGERSYREPAETDLLAATASRSRIASVRSVEVRPGVPELPDEAIPHEKVWKNNPIRVHLYGMATWGHLFSPRQAAAMVEFSQGVRAAHIAMLAGGMERSRADAVATCLALAVDRLADHLNTLCTWNPSGPKLQHLFTRQALPMVWDFAEANPFGDSVGDWMHNVECVAIALGNANHSSAEGTVQRASAVALPLPDDCADALLTDPPYYDAVPYAKLSNFFYVWLRRTLGGIHPDLFAGPPFDGAGECVVDEAKGQNGAYFERLMADSLAEARRVVHPRGVGVVVFAHKSTAGWEAQVNAMIQAGWTVTASWPIDTEMGTRMRAMDSAALASSIHLVCRPREGANGALVDDSIGDWRDIVAELPQRIHAWMPRLAAEGVVGADAIFACLGPALEIYSRYARVEDTDGSPVELRRYLEKVWETVAKEALDQIFRGGDATGFEEDARLTAMWLWTLTAGLDEGRADADDDDDDDEGKPKARGGFALEYDAARKISQGLGAHLEALGTLVEVSGKTAWLLPVADRAAALFGKAEVHVSVVKSGKKVQNPQMKLGFVQAIEQAESERTWGEIGAPTTGRTTLDRVHQAMLLFGANRGEALRRFLVEDGAGTDERFWRLAQALNQLYPPKTDERRWVEGVLARKKMLGF